MNQDKWKEELKRYQGMVEEELKRYFSELKKRREFLVGPGEKIVEHLEEYVMRPAKRVRGCLVLKVYELLGGDASEVLGASVAMELIQAGLLMHDDVIDEDELRRGGETTHKFFGKDRDEKYGESMAIAVGDIALFLAGEEISKLKIESENLVRALRMMNEGVARTALGEAWDVEIEGGEAVEKDVLGVSEAKTSIYTVQMPLLIGVMLAGGSKGDEGLVRKLSVPMGVAFQLRDDWLGVFGESEKMGKSKSDIRQRKMTMLIALSLKDGNEEEREVVRRVWGKVDATEEEMREIKTVIKRRAEGGIEKMVGERLSVVKEVLREGLESGWQKEVVEWLESLADYVGKMRVR